MTTLVSALVLLIAVQHIFFMILEMFLWTKPIGLRTFHLTPELARETAPLAANQGLYNGFLAAGLIWSFFISSAPEAFRVQVFFLSCVLVAGIFGGLTAKKDILVVQALPGFIALIARLWVSA